MIEIWPNALLALGYAGHHRPTGVSAQRTNLHSEEKMPGSSSRKAILGSDENYVEVANVLRKVIVM